MKPLKIVIISKKESATVSEEFVPALSNRGHDVEVVNLSIVPLSNFETHPLVTALFDKDLVYYRTGLPTAAAITLERLLKDNGVKTVNLQFTEFPYIHYKTCETMLGVSAGTIVPKTLFDCTEDYQYVVETLGSPFVAKPDVGTKGDGVVLVRNVEEYSSLTATDSLSRYLFQEFIPHDAEYRVFCIGGEVVGIQKRIPAEGDFRSNWAQGGGMENVEEEYVPALSEAALRVYKVAPLEIMVADFMHHKETGEFYFTELNLNPGWNSDDYKVSGGNLTEKAADYFEKILNS